MTRSIAIHLSLGDLFTLKKSLMMYVINVSQQKDFKLEQYYCVCLIKYFLKKLQKRTEALMNKNGDRIKVVFEVPEAVLLVDVLQQVEGNTTSDTILFHLGSICPNLRKTT